MSEPEKTGGDAESGAEGARRRKRSRWGANNTVANEAKRTMSEVPQLAMQQVSTQNQALAQNQAQLAIAAIQQRQLAAQAAVSQLNTLHIPGQTQTVAAAAAIEAANKAAMVAAQLQQQAQGTQPATQNKEARIYIGNIYYEVSQADLTRVFAQFGAIRHVEMPMDGATGRHKGFGFVEYQEVATAEAALATMQSFKLMGRTLKVGRPHNAVSPMATMPTQAGAPALSGIPMPLSPKMPPAPLGPAARLKVMNVDPAVDEDALTALAATCGDLQECHMLGNHTAYLDFIDADTAKTALQVLNGLDLAGRPLQCSLVGAAPSMPDVGMLAAAMPQGTPAGVSAGAAAAMRMIANLNAGLGANGTPFGAPLVKPPEQEISLSQEVSMTVGANQRQEIMKRLLQRTVVPSRCVVLRNMVAPADCDDALENEISSECGKHGSVERVIIYEDATLRLVKIFVLFEEVAAAEKAIAALHNRWFGGRCVQAEMYPEDRFQKQDLNG